MGFVLADVSGKGVSAALLMANLQANIRSQYVGAHEDLAVLFRSVNKLFYESVMSGFFATLFFAEYFDATRELRYVNCGHCPAFLFHTNGSSEKLHATATVLGMFGKVRVRSVKQPFLTETSWWCIPTELPKHRAGQANSLVKIVCSQRFGQMQVCQQRVC